MKVHERSISDLEDENVQMAKEHEDRQLIWEQREVELERMIDKLEKQQRELAEAATKFEEATGSIPDPNLPVANQLEMAISKIKEHIRTIIRTREENKQLKKVVNVFGEVLLLRVIGSKLRTLIYWIGKSYFTSLAICKLFLIVNVEVDWSASQ